MVCVSFQHYIHSLKIYFTTLQIVFIHIWRTTKHAEHRQYHDKPENNSSVAGSGHVCSDKFVAG